MITTPIDHLSAHPQAFDTLFAEPAKLGEIGHNWPALQAQSAPVVFYFRAAHLAVAGSPEYKRCLRAAQDRINFGRPMAGELWRDLAAMISA